LAAIKFKKRFIISLRFRVSISGHEDHRKIKRPNKQIAAEGHGKGSDDDD